MKNFVFPLLLMMISLLSPTLYAQNLSDQIEALEASIREARAMGLDQATIDQMQTMLDVAKAEQSNRGMSGQGSNMGANHFDELNARSYSDCDQFSDNIAFSYCQAAAHYFLMYVETHSQEGDTEAANQIYAGHVEAVENLIQYVDNFMTAPRQ